MLLRQLVSDYRRTCGIMLMALLVPGLAWVSRLIRGELSPQLLWGLGIAAIICIIAAMLTGEQLLKRIVLIIAAVLATFIVACCFLPANWVTFITHPAFVIAYYSMLITFAVGLVIYFKKVNY